MTILNFVLFLVAFCLIIYIVWEKYGPGAPVQRAEHYQNFGGRANLGGSGDGYQNLDSKLFDLLQNKRINQENFATLSSKQEDKYIQKLVRRADILLENLINNPIPNTFSHNWKRVMNDYKQDIGGLSIIEQYIQHQFAYTQNKGEKLKLCLCDDDGEVDLDLNMYVLLHELTHIYDPDYATTKESHGPYFWRLFARLIKRAISLNLLNPSIFNKKQNRCETDIIFPEDIALIEERSNQPLDPK